VHHDLDHLARPTMPARYPGDVFDRIAAMPDPYPPPSAYCDRPHVPGWLLPALGVLALLLFACAGLVALDLFG
jgi:hypothetical protein